MKGLSFLFVGLVAGLVAFFIFESFTNSKTLRTQSGVYKEVCLNGVIYYESPSAVTPKFQPSSLVVPCGS